MGKMAWGKPEKAPEQSPLRVGGAFLSMMAALALVWLPVQARFLLLNVCFMVHFILPRVARRRQATQLINFEPDQI